MLVNQLVKRKGQGSSHRSGLGVHSDPDTFLTDRLPHHWVLALASLGRLWTLSQEQADVLLGRPATAPVAKASLEDGPKRRFLL